MGEGLDPRLLEEFRLADQARSLFLGLGWTVEPWVAMRLARTEGEHLRRELDRLGRLKQAGRGASLGGLLADSVERIRRTMGRRALEMRDSISTCGVPLDPIHLELVLALLLRDGAGAVTEKAVWTKSRELQSYLAAPSEPTALSGQPLPPGVDAELLEDLRHVEVFMGALAPARPKAEVWEAFSLAVRDRRSAKQAVERMRSPDDLNSEVIRLFEGLLEVRALRGEKAELLRRFIAGLPIGSYQKETMELAIAFILASEEGCRRLDQWMESPEHFRREAAIRVEGVIGRAQKYLHALRLSA
jgi:hypothetical protein